MHDIEHGFRTQYDRTRVVSRSGDSIIPVLSAEVDSDGSFKLVKTGEKNLYAEIQSHRDSTDINLIMKRFELGNDSVLHKTQGFYADIVDFPKTYAEMQQRFLDAQAAFDGLSLSDKEKFNMDVNQFISSIGTEEWYAKLGFKKMAVTEPAQPSVTEPAQQESNVFTQEGVI